MSTGASKTATSSSSAGSATAVRAIIYGFEIYSRATTTTRTRCFDRRDGWEP